MMADTDFPDELNYATSTEANLDIARALGEIRFMEKMRVLMPLVAKELVDAGVDFSKANFDSASSGDNDVTSEGSVPHPPN